MKSPFHDTARFREKAESCPDYEELSSAMRKGELAREKKDGIIQA